MEEPQRLILGYHAQKGRKTLKAYGRDEISPLVERLSHIVDLIKCGAFSPDKDRCDQWRSEEDRLAYQHGEPITLTNGQPVDAEEEAVEDEEVASQSSGDSSEHTPLEVAGQAKRAATLSGLCVIIFPRLLTAHVRGPDHSQTLCGAQLAVGAYEIIPEEFEVLETQAATYIRFNGQAYSTCRRVGCCERQFKRCILKMNPARQS